MNYRQKCKLKGEWAYVKYKGDAAIYAVCQNCGFTYACYKTKRNEDGSWAFATEPEKPYKYCPCCGLKMHLFNGNEIYKIDKFSWE